MTGAPDPSGPQRHSPEDTQGVTESFWSSPGSGERCLPAAPPQEGAGPLSGRGAPASTAEHAVNRREVVWCSSKREGGSRWQQSRLTSAHLGQAWHPASQAGLSPYTLPGKPRRLTPSSPSSRPFWPRQPGFGRQPDGHPSSQRAQPYSPGLQQSPASPRSPAATGVHLPCGQQLWARRVLEAPSHPHQ